MKKLLLITAIWCPSCLIMRPRYQKLAHEYGYQAIEEVDYDDQQTLIKNLKIGMTLPVAIFMDQQIELTRIIGEHSEKKLREILTKI